MLARLDGADLREADLTCAVLLGARMRGTKLAGANLDRCWLDRAMVDLPELRAARGSRWTLVDHDGVGTTARDPR